jgi:hypothetical protein
LLLILQAIVKTASGFSITREEALKMMGAAAVTPAILNPTPKMDFAQSFAPLPSNVHPFWHILFLWTLLLSTTRANANLRMLGHCLRRRRLHIIEGAHCI